MPDKSSETFAWDFIRRIGGRSYRAILLLTWIAIVVSMLAIDDRLASQVAIIAVAWVWIASVGSLVASDVVWRRGHWFARGVAFVGVASALLNCLVTLLVSAVGGNMEGGWIAPWGLTWVLVFIAVPVVPVCVIVIRFGSHMKGGRGIGSSE